MAVDPAREAAEAMREACVAYHTEQESLWDTRDDGEIPAAFHARAAFALQNLPLPTVPSPDSKTAFLETCREPWENNCDELFEGWWGRDGKYLDPDTADVPWSDKRKGLAAYAYRAAMSQSGNYVADRDVYASKFHFSNGRIVMLTSPVPSPPPQSGDELLPCPFCAAPAEMDAAQGYLALPSGKVGSRVTIYCTSCAADMGWCREDHPDMPVEEMIYHVREDWNRRVITPQAVEVDLSLPREISLKLSSREDGGLRIRSDDLPGLVLSGKDIPAMLRDLPKVIALLLEHNGLAPTPPVNAELATKGLGSAQMLAGMNWIVANAPLPNEWTATMLVDLCQTIASAERAPRDI